MIANSQATLETLELPRAVQSVAIHNGVLVERSRVVHDGVDAFVCPVPDPLHTGPPIVGIVGRITPWKGQHIFIEAAAAVRREVPDARFQIIGAAMFGEDAYDKQIREQAAALGLNECVEFTGFCADVPGRLQSLTLLVHASTTGEPFGQVLLEGMVAAKPIIATRGGGVVEIVEDGVTGLLVPMNDAPALATAILDVLKDPVAAHKMGRAGYCRVREHFGIKRTAERVESVYRDLLDRPKHGNKERH